jgi:hypothetical protein
MRAFLVVAVLFLAPVGDVVARECVHVVMMSDGTKVCNDQGNGGCDGGTNCTATACDDGKPPHCLTCGGANASCIRVCEGNCIVKIDHGHRSCMQPDVATCYP